MAWILLVIAGFMEVGWAIGLKQSEGFTRPIPTAITLVLMAGSMWLLGVAARTLPIGTAYAVWTGIGAVGTALIGLLFLHEPATAGRLACLVLIVAGIVGLKVLTPA
jgi:quaternary ammonium compound-resistance protein SugE